MPSRINLGMFRPTLSDGNLTATTVERVNAALKTAVPPVTLAPQSGS